MNILGQIEDSEGNVIGVLTGDDILQAQQRALAAPIPLEQFTATTDDQVELASLPAAPEIRVQGSQPIASGPDQTPP